MRADVQKTGPSGALARFLRAVLTWRYLPIGLAILAMALVLPSLNVGWFMDDYLHRSVILGGGSVSEFVHSPLDIFRFIDGNPEHTAHMMDHGFLPWWTFKEIKGAFWRPLTAITHWLDYQIWPESPALMHAQSIVWFGLLVTAVALLYRRFMGFTWIAGLAGLLYAIDDAHGIPVGFLANRNAVLATLFGVLALVAHDRWRRDGWRAGAILGPILLTAALLSAEIGVGICAYLVAYALILDRGSWSRRLATLVPYVAVVLVWRISWTQLGYGVEGMGWYIDPINDPTRFAGSALKYAPLLLMGQWFLPPAEIGSLITLTSRHATTMWLYALAIVLLIGTILVPLLRRSRLARFWALAMLLAVVPACATLAWDRLLFFVGIGAMGLLAQLLADLFGASALKPRNLIRRFATVSFALVLVLVHMIAAPILLPLRAAYSFGPWTPDKDYYAQCMAGGAVEEQDVVIVNQPAALATIFLLCMRELNDQPVPRHMRVLAPAIPSVLIHRPDVQTLTIRPKYGYLGGYLGWCDQLFRGKNHPMALGEQVKLTGMTVTVTELTDDGRPAEATFRFAVPLEDSSLRWIYWEDHQFKPFVPPAIGETIELQH